MALLRAASATAAQDTDSRAILGWYERTLAKTTPPTDLRWQPIKIGPTWSWTPSGGWLLPRATLGWDVLVWCGTWLQDGKGRPWAFTPEQARFLLWFYALDEQGDFLYHSAVLQRLKGWGKDPVLSAVSAAACFAPVTFDHWVGDRPVGREEQNAYVQIFAVTLAQAKKNTMSLFPSLIPHDTRRHYGIQVGKTDIWGLGDTRHIQAVPSSVEATEGPRPTLVGRGETQNWNASNGGHDLAAAIEGNVAKSPGAAARILDVCNAYRPGQDSVAEREREAWESTQGDDAKAMDYGLLYDSLEAPPKAPLTAKDAPEVARAVAGDATWLDTRPNGRIVKSIINPANSPSESRRKWFNQIVAAEDAWVLPEQWDDCKSDRLLIPGEKVFWFFDGSKSGDATALVGCAESDGHLFLGGVWQAPPKRGRADKEWLVDRYEVDHFVRQEIIPTYKAVGFWGDPSDARDDETGERFWEPIFDGWAKDFGRNLKLKAVKSGPNQHAVTWDMRNPRNTQTFTEHAERFTTDVKDKRISQDGSAMLTQHVRNARRRPNKWGISLGKEHPGSRKKVDLAVCAVGARMMRHLYLHTQKQRGGKVW